MAKSTSKKDTARKLAIDVARIADDSNSLDTIVMDLRGISPVTDYFVICTGTSNRQMRSTADAISEHGLAVGQRAWHVAGLEGGQWIVLDFVDVVVHIFDEAHRRYYDLELIWGESPKVRWKRPGKASDKTSQTPSDKAEQ